MAAHRIVFANEKGGSGKSTSAVHVAVALAAMGRSVAVLDLDTRQRTLGRYLDNRAATIQREGVALAMPACDTFDPAKGVRIEARLDAMAEEVDFLVVDTPGRDDDHVRAAISSADTLVTPISARPSIARIQVSRSALSAQFEFAGRSINSTTKCWLVIRAVRAVVMRRGPDWG